jgi:hypothetical protein
LGKDGTIMVHHIKADEMGGAFNVHGEKMNGLENVKEQDHRKN